MLNGMLAVSDVGEVIMQKIFLPNAEMDWSPDLFAAELKKRNYSLPMSVKIGKTSYIHIPCDKVRLVALTTLDDAPSCVILAYLEQISDMLKDFLGSVTKDSMRQNIALVYELVCESTSAGFPKLLESQKLKTFLCNLVSLPPSTSTTNDLLSVLPENLFGSVGDGSKRVLPNDAPKKSLLAKSGRQEKNEVFIDLVENLSVIVGASGQMLFYKVEGNLEAKSFLAKPATMSVRFAGETASKEFFQNSIFHKTVAKSSDPPGLTVPIDPGTLRVMRYSIDSRTETNTLPFMLYANVVPVKSDKMLVLNLKIHSTLPGRNPANNFAGSVHLPGSTITTSGSSSLANMEFNYDKHKRLFTFSSALFPGESNHSVSIKVLVDKWTPTMKYEMSTVCIKFEAPMFSQTSLRISDFKVKSIDSSSTPVQRWVRYLTYSKSYEFYLKEDWFDQA